MPAMDPKVLAETREIEAKKDYDNPRYMALLVPNYYALHILRMPPDQWPDPVNRAFARLNKDVYVPMQGPSEMSASGKLEKWDRSALFGKGRYLYCADGSHTAMYDDQKTYFDGLIKFIKDVDQGRL